MRKKIVCILAAALFAVTLPLTADAKTGTLRGTENVPAETVTVTAEMIRTDANKKNGSPETVPWDPEALRGKTFSILGDSISSYRNISNRRGSRWSNTTIGRGAAWYSDLKPKLKAEETWWMQLSEDLGLRLLVNNYVLPTACQDRWRLCRPMRTAPRQHGHQHRRGTGPYLYISRD